MNVAWIIMDSVSYSATSLSRSSNVNTTPKLKTLADMEGIVFNNCYTPAYASPGSHASMFTGMYPAETGIHKATPRNRDAYAASSSRIAERINHTHESMIVSQNPFIFYGLDSEFSQSIDLQQIQNVPFPEAHKRGNSLSSSSKLTTLANIFGEDMPVRSIINRLRLRLTDNNDIEDLSEIGNIRSYMHSFIKNVESNSHPYFIVANYMHAHPPFTPSVDAIRSCTKFSPDDLPIGEKLPFRSDRPRSDEYELDKLLAVYYASIYELDRKITPMIENLLNNGVTVFLMADHGRAVYYDDPLGEDRIHVPLVIFDPNSAADERSHTVNLKDVARTTTSILSQHHEEVDMMPGTDLLNVDENTISLTEYIHHSKNAGNDPPESTSAIRGVTDDVIYRICGIAGETRVDYDHSTGEFTKIRGTESQSNDIIERIKQHLDRNLSNRNSQTNLRSDVSEANEDQLRKLGYLD
jgi:hypothetical protein